MKIKVCGIKDLENLKSILALQPDFIGFNFYEKSARFCTFDLPSNLDFAGCRKVGVFVNATLAQIGDYIERYRLDLLQLHGDENPDFLAELKNRFPQQKIIKVFRLENELPDLIPWRNIADYYLFDTAAKGYGGSGVRFDWKLVKDLNIENPFFLAGGIAPDSVSELKKMDYVFAVDINSKFEVSAGVKDIRLVGDFIGELRQ